MTLPSTKQRYNIPDLPKTEDLIPYLKQIDENRWYSNFGPLANQFQNDFIKTMGAAHNDSHPYGCAVMASGYYALNVGLRLLGIGKGSTVLVPSVTFPACALVVQNMGANLLLSDVDKESWTLTPEIARAAAKHNKIDAVMPVSVYGIGVPAEEWDKFTEETGIKVIIDAAAAIETQRYLKHGIVAHSLHALKPLGIGEGGMLVTPTEEMATDALQSINFGMQNRITLMKGENAKMSEYHAAVACAQLIRWPDIKKCRKKITNYFFKALETENRAKPHPLLEETITSSLMISFNDPIADDIFDALLKRGVAAHRTYLPPLYEHPHLTDTPTVNPDGQIGTKTGMSGSEWMKKHVIGLPFHTFMDEKEVNDTVKILTECIDTLSQKQQMTGTKTNVA